MRQKLFTLINVIGLSIGISASIVIGLIVYHDLTFDKFHKDVDRIYRVVTNFSFDGRLSYNPGVSGALPAAVKSEVTGLEGIATTYRILLPDVFVTRGNEKPVKFKEQRGVVLADEGYFKLFEYKWLSGSAKTALHEPNQVVITSKQADIYFPGTAYADMIGKTIIYDSIKTSVSGVVENFKENSDLTFHDFISYNTHLTNAELNQDLRLNNWGGTSVKEQFFVKLSPRSRPEQIESQLNTILVRNRPEALNKERKQQFALQSFNDIHFNDRYLSIDTADRHGSKPVLYGLLSIAAFLLVLACINFINLNTAQASQRAKEIGIRKTMGSSRRQVIFQFLSETFVVTLLAVVISVGLCPFVLQLFDGLIPQGISISSLTQAPIIVFLIALTVVVSLLSGFYPALILSAYKPVAVFKDQSRSNTGKTRSGALRRVLTVSQFVIAQFFIMATILVSKQIWYATHKDLGFKKDAVVTITSPFRHRTAQQNALLAQKFRSLPQVEIVSMGHDAPSSENTSSTEATFNNGKKELKTEVSMKIGDENYINLYHIKLLAGRNLQPADTNHAVLVNQTYARMMGFQDLNGVVGQHIDNFNGDQRMKIVGVVGDFQQESMRSSLTPLVILHTTDVNWNATFHIALKPQTAGGDEWQRAFTNLEGAWKQVYPGHDFEYEFVDRSIANLYQSEQQTASLLNWATGLSVLISCLGLLGLAIFTTGQRVKEIGVRKVLGASIGQIVSLLTKELVWLVALAFVIVLPIAWYAAYQWLQNFADRTVISWWIFALSGSGMLIVAFITSGLQTVKAAMANPVKSLRSE
ncbi:ABC transporter permease [Mucilaginibacter myungsuensis]